MIDHPLMTTPPTAYGIALALAESFRPDRYVRDEAGYATLDSELLARDATLVSTGESVVIAIVRSLAGDAPVDLSRVDALDDRLGRLVADALGCLAYR